MQAIEQIINSQIGAFCKIGQTTVFKNESFTKP